MSPSVPRLVILGTGFGACNLIKRLNDDYAITIVNSRTHFLSDWIKRKICGRDISQFSLHRHRHAW